jgi:Na+-translocating ferredoxin:NAD+ oxidoreductase RnfG subunit
MFGWKVVKHVLNNINICNKNLLEHFFSLIFSFVLQEEIIKVEMAMRKQAIEQVREERARAEKNLKETVTSVEERCDKEKEHAVQKTRREEQAIADGAIKELEA